MTISYCSCIKGNEDNLNQAVQNLNEFTHNWCMDCKQTELENDLIFRCEECSFQKEDGTCAVKEFVRTNLPNFKDFGCMGDL